MAAIGPGQLHLSLHGGGHIYRCNIQTQPGTFFTTSEMKGFIGTVNNERGHEFSRLIADKLRKKGWQARSEDAMRPRVDFWFGRFLSQVAVTHQKISFRPLK